MPQFQSSTPARASLRRPHPATRALPEILSEDIVARVDIESLYFQSLALITKMALFKDFGTKVRLPGLVLADMIHPCVVEIALGLD